MLVFITLIFGALFFQSFPFTRKTACRMNNKQDTIIDTLKKRSCQTMHTTNHIRSSDFEFMINGRAATFHDIFPDFNRHDRIGVVVRQTGGGIGASALIMAAMARFYDFYREKLGHNPDQLRIYPEFYIFHVGKRHMDHYWMDIWPPHKEVEVTDEPEQILEAINDRGISRLLVQDAKSVPVISLSKSIPNNEINPSAAIFLRETISSAEHRILTSLAYSPSGRTAQADILVKSCEAAEHYVTTSINSSVGLSAQQREQLLSGRQALLSEGRITETYRRISLFEAFGMLTHSTKISPTTRRYIEMM
jgi:hypothetical protein